MDIDTGLFQLVTLALLGVTLLVLVVTLLSLGKLSKKLDEGVGASAALPSHHDHEHHDEHAHHDHEHHDEHAHHDQPASAVDDGSPSTAQYPAATAEEPAPETVGAASVTTTGETPADYQQPAEVTQELGDVAPEPVASEAAPAEEREAAPAVQEPEPVVAEQAPTGTGFEDAPEEQPFERDGRWWFKRGNEILVYDEQTGQWGPAPAAAPVVAAPAPAAAGDAAWSQEEQAQGWGQPEPGQPEPGQPQGEAEAPATTFWKCPSCGAINGATATACRMCFTPKA